MFCFQCQGSSQRNCVAQSKVCAGKTAMSRIFQDTLLFVLKGVAALNGELRKAGLAEAKVNKVIFDGLFSYHHQRQFRRCGLFNPNQKNAESTRGIAFES